MPISETAIFDFAKACVCIIMVLAYLLLFAVFLRASMNRYFFTVLVVVPVFAISKKPFKEAFPNNPLTAKILYTYFNQSLQIHNQSAPGQPLPAPAVKQIALGVNANIEVVNISKLAITLETRIFDRNVDFNNLDETMLFRERKLLSGCLLTAMRNKKISSPLQHHFIKLDDHTSTNSFDALCTKNMSLKCRTVIPLNQFIELQKSCQGAQDKAITEEICKECIDRYFEDGQIGKEDTRFRFKREGKLLLIEYNFGIIRGEGTIKVDPSELDALNNRILREVRARTIVYRSLVKLDNGTRCNAPHFINATEGVVRCQTLVTLKQFNQIKEKFLKEQAEKNMSKPAVQNS
jgi:hypothetical protein